MTLYGPSPGREHSRVNNAGSRLASASEKYGVTETVFTRWSLSRDDADFSGASVTRTLNGNNVALRNNAVQNGYGLNTLVWEPINLVLPTDGTVATIKVTVNNVVVSDGSQNFQYDVIAIKPPTGALSVVNYLNQFGTGLLLQNLAGLSPFLDVNGDTAVSPLDVLVLVNYLNTRSGNGEGEEGGAVKIENESIASTNWDLDSHKERVRRAEERKLLFTMRSEGEELDSTRVGKSVANKNVCE